MKDLVGDNALHIAAFHGHARLVQLLLSAGANVNGNTKYQGTPLRIAVSRGHIRIINILLSSGANIDSKDYNGCSPLHLAASTDRTTASTVVQALIAGGANIEEKKNGCRILQRVVQEGSLNALRVLLEADNDVNGGNKEERDQRSEWTALHTVARYNEFTKAHLLLAAGVNIDEIFLANKTTALHVAAERNSLEIVQSLLNRGVDITATNVYGQTALAIATSNGHTKIVLQLQEEEENSEQQLTS